MYFNYKIFLQLVKVLVAMNKKAGNRITCRRALFTRMRKETRVEVQLSLVAAQ